MSASGRRVLPPAYLLGALLLMAGIHRFAPFIPILPPPWQLGGVALIGGGLLMITVPARTFHRRGTAIRPFRFASITSTSASPR